ncbi:hypothetical protein ANANG_G00303420 [Anguilla anguilla]|uniref:Uncharacterized protein n=1 Tax=Anguilla anguilla TaxID=7936 RepID=A0A0E9WVV5_ANGAN|nr:hypothetical protein ANANG_G00303420 [Anguilla anguilla]
MSEINIRENLRAAEIKELKQLQQELLALRRVRSSLHAVERMVGCLSQNVQLAIKNGDTLADLNQGWNVFFTGKK